MELHEGHRRTLTLMGSREGVQVGSAGMENQEGASVPTTLAHPSSGTRTAWPASPVTCCCRARQAGAGQEPGGCAAAARSRQSFMALHL